jgi:hypothetical protein
MDDRAKLTEQETRWRDAIHGLVCVAAFVHEHEVLKPRYTIGTDKLWKIRLTTGEVGWCRAYVTSNGVVPQYFLPAAIAQECFLKECQVRGLDRQWTLRSQGRTRDDHFVKAIFTATPQRVRHLEAEMQA